MKAKIVNFTLVQSINATGRLTGKQQPLSSDLSVKSRDSDTNLRKHLNGHGIFKIEDLLNFDCKKTINQSSAVYA